MPVWLRIFRIDGGGWVGVIVCFFVLFSPSSHTSLAVNSCALAALLASGQPRPRAGVIKSEGDCQDCTARNFYDASIVLKKSIELL